ncbi:MAG: hypothetical protein QM730_27950 [Anaerolineales bacterium]
MMLKTRTIVGSLLVFMMIVSPMMSVGAAAPAQTTTIDGTVQSCITGIDGATGDTIVICDINLIGGGTKTVRLSVGDAVTKGLATLNEDGTVTIIATLGQVVSIDETLVLADPCVTPEGASQPISKLLANYFCGDLGLGYDDLQSLHEEGFGFGEIAQACFMALKLDGTGQLCADILYAKKSGDYSGLTLPDGVTVSNWGQLRKAILDHEKKNSNLGSVVSEKDKNDKENGKDNSNKDNGNGKANEEHGKPTK